MEVQRTHSAVTLEYAIEAMIFAADEPLTAAQIAGVYASVTGEEAPAASEIQDSVDRLNNQYEQSGRSFRINRWGGGYRMATVPAAAPFLKAMFNSERERKLSRSVMETLAIVAYRQPVTRSEVDFVRGVDSDYAIRKLLDMGLVDVVGRSESIGRPLLYGTTSLFLEQFGIDTLADLPSLREIQELLNDPAFNNERAQLLALGDTPEYPLPEDT